MVSVVRSPLPLGPLLPPRVAVHHDVQDPDEDVDGVQVDTNGAAEVGRRWGQGVATYNCGHAVDSTFKVHSRYVHSRYIQGTFKIHANIQ